MSRQNRPSLNLLKDKHDLIGIEIGVKFGENAKWMLENLDIKKLYLIDPYEEYRCNNNKPLDKGGMHPALPEAKKGCKKLLKKWEDKIEYIYKFSWDAMSDIEDKSIDFIYIDGDHRQESVLKDLEYIKKLKYGGLLCGHDWRFKSVKEALTQFMSEKRLKFNCCRTDQFIKIIDRKAEGNDWYISTPETSSVFQAKCKFCQNEYEFYTGDIDWL